MLARTCAQSAMRRRPRRPGGRLAECRRPSPPPPPSSSPSSNEAGSSSPATPGSPSSSPPTAPSPRKLGDPSALILPRSSLKPLQALACLTAGAPLEGERLALATASHSGTDRHVAVVRDILAAAGLGEERSRLPARLARRHGDAATSWCASCVQPSRVRMNCSGKHAAMLLTCTTNGWDTGRLPRAGASAAGSHPRGHRAPHRREGRRDRHRRLRRTGLRDDAVRARPRDPPHRQLVADARRSHCTAAPARWCRPCARTRGRSTGRDAPTPS